MSLPVWLKDGRGGERTHTVDVSAHGIAVLAGHARPLRQYVELELRLQDPEQAIAVTAVVARHAALLHPESGAPVEGLGLDFFLFDAQAKAAWQAFIRRLHAHPDGAPRAGTLGTALAAGPAAPRPAAASLPPPPPPAAPEEEDDTPTFIIKPRDLGRLWAFFRGEMAKGMVRIETPILKPVGSPAELLVVHPTSLSEWALPGRVARATEAGRGGRPVLEIGLTPMAGDLKAAFRNFVATGRGQVEEEILISSEIAVPAPGELRAPAPDAHEEPERIESVVIDLDNLDGLEDFGDAAFSEESISLGSGLMEAPRFVTHPSGVTPSGLLPASPDEEPPEDDPTQHAPSPLVAPSRSLSGPGRREAEERPTSVFASFFAEAGLSGAPEPAAEAPVKAWIPPEITAESQLDLAAVSRAKSQAAAPPPPPPPPAPVSAAPRARPPAPPPPDLEPALEEPIPLVQRRRATPPPPPPPEPVPDLTAEPELPPPPPPRRAVPPLPPSARMRASAPAAAQAMPRSRRRPDDDPSVQVRPVSLPAEPQAVVQGRRDNLDASPLAAMNPPVPPGQMFDFGDPSQPNLQVRAGQLAPVRDPSGLVITPRSDPSVKVKAPARGAVVERGPVVRRTPARRGPVEEPERAQEHRMLSTEGTNPGLDRDIALARARVVRSPHSVTACYRLSALLLQRGENGALDEAVSALEKVMALEPNHPGAHHKLAELHARRGDYEKAAEHLNRARRLGYQVDPDLERLVNNASRP